MLRYANLTIDPEAYDAVPQSLRIEHGVLPLDIHDGVLRLAFPFGPWAASAVAKFEFILDRPLRPVFADAGRLRSALGEIDANRLTIIDGCPAADVCPRRWLRLRPGRSPKVRTCDSCGRAVERFVTASEAADRPCPERVPAVGHHRSTVRGDRHMREKIAGCLTRRVTAARRESEVADGAVPCGDRDVWRAFKASCGPGDEMWEFSTVEASMGFASGIEGIAVMRRGKAIAYVVTGVVQ